MCDYHDFMITLHAGIEVNIMTSLSNVKLLAAIDCIIAALPLACETGAAGSCVESPGLRQCKAGQAYCQQAAHNVPCQAGPVCSVLSQNHLGRFTYLCGLMSKY